MAGHVVSARPDDTFDQLVDVTVDHGYRPQTILARADVPLRLVFHRVDDEACSERVVFSAPRLERHLAPHSDTTIVLPPQPEGEVRFTCAMGRYRGQIEFQRGDGRSIVERLAEQISRREGPLGTAVVLWLCSLPLIAVAGVLLLDPAATLLAALFALLAWVAGCLWAFADHPRIV